MIKYIKKNKHWIFSGIGVLGITLLISIIVYMISGRGSDTKSQISTSSNTQLAASPNIVGQSAPRMPNNVAADTQPREFAPTPTEIHRAMKDAPLLQRDDLRKNYQGLRVDSKLKLFTASKEGNNVSLSFLYQDTFYPDIVCEVNIDQYRELLLMKAGTEIRVIGTIRKIERYSQIDLSDVSLIY